MLEPLNICTNPVHEFTIFKMLVVWQIANDIWCITQKNNNRNTIYFGFSKVQYEEGDAMLYSVIIWKLSIKFGFFK